MLTVPRRGILREDFELDARWMRLKTRERIAGLPVVWFPGAPTAINTSSVPAGTDEGESSCVLI